MHARLLAIGLAASLFATSAVAQASANLDAFVEQRTDDAELDQFAPCLRVMAGLARRRADERKWFLS